MDSNAPNNQDVQVTNDNLSDFQPKDSGQLDRLLNRDNVRPNQSSAVDQILGVPVSQEFNNANNYDFNRTVEFPQPSYVGLGFVTSAGAADSAKFFLSQLWTVSKTGTGVYSVVHNMSTIKYIVLPVAFATTAVIIQVSAYNANDFEIKTFDAAGAAVDSAFTFAVLMIP